ncbi:MAG: uroporphyrinogen-III decarboxylase-like protein, partial [Planctomycetes bacterium]|nr:uroporphyrinogen-III decarboxylase-like protein [Planctomycetota bacterium]
MPKETMTPRERWLAIVNHEVPDRVPLHYRATEEADAKLMKYLGVSTAQERNERLHIEPHMGVGGRYVGPKPPPGKDILGLEYRAIEYDGGVYRECANHPLAEYKTVEEIEANFTWPDPDWWDYSHIPAQVEGKDDIPVSGGGSEPFLRYKYLRGDIQAFIDLVENPEIVHYILDKLFGLCYESTRRTYEQMPGRVDWSTVAEDLGSQESLLYSPQQIRTFLLPRMKMMMDLAHQAGAKVITHSDGAIRDILPDLIEAGADILDPVQWRCKGMEREGLKRDFGDQVIFHGAMDNQYTLAFGSVDEVRQEVIDNLQILGAGGGYILAPCHNIQAVSPPENIVAMYETGYEYGW